MLIGVDLIQDFTRHPKSLQVSLRGKTVKCEKTQDHVEEPGFGNDAVYNSPVLTFVTMDFY